MPEYERAAETDVFITGDTVYKTLKQKITPHSGYNWLYVVLPYYLCTASKMSNFREISALLAKKFCSN